jgi:hypothetical protein
MAEHQGTQSRPLEFGHVGSCVVNHRISEEEAQSVLSEKLAVADCLAGFKHDPAKLGSAGSSRLAHSRSDWHSRGGVPQFISRRIRSVPLLPAANSL